MNSSYTFKERLQMSLGLIALSFFVWFMPHTVMEKLVGAARRHNLRS